MFPDRSLWIDNRKSYGRNKGGELGPSGFGRVLDGNEFLGASKNRTADLRELDARGRSQCQFSGTDLARG